jgi:carbon monoxide dehydrogenase subunit G
MMVVDETFTVQTEPAAVWQVVSNPHEVVDCVPGATLVGQRDDGAYEGSVVVKFGPTSVAFKTLVTLELDPDAREGHFVSQARDSKGGTRSKAAMTFRVVAADGGGSIVHMQGKVEVSGPLAGMVESGATFVVKRMVTEVAQRLAAKCAPVAADPADSTQLPSMTPGQAVSSATRTTLWRRILSRLLTPFQKARVDERG